MGQKKKEMEEEIEEKKEEVGTIIKTSCIQEEKSKAKHISPRNNPLASIAGKIVPKSVVERLTSNKNNPNQRNFSPPGEIHNRLYELHNLDKKKREKNEAIRLENIRKEESK